MIGLRQIIIIGLLVLGFWWFRRLQRRWAKQPDSRPKRAYRGMARCAHCGVFVPLDRAIGSTRQGFFCTEEHARLGPVEHDHDAAD